MMDILLSTPYQATTVTWCTCRSWWPDVYRVCCRLHGSHGGAPCLCRRLCVANLATLRAPSSLHLAALAAVTECEYLRNGVPSALSSAATGERADRARRRALDNAHRAYHLDGLPPAGVGRGAPHARVAALGRHGARAGIVTRAGRPFADRRRGRNGRRALPPVPASTIVRSRTRGAVRIPHARAAPGAGFRHTSLGRRRCQPMCRCASRCGA